MPLSNVERQVLELVCREGKKCRGGVPTPTVARLVEPYNPSATVGTLHVLKSEGLLSVTGADEHSRGWMATTKGEAALRSGVELEVDGFMDTTGFKRIPKEGTWLLEKGEPVSNQPQRLLTSEDLSLLDRREFKPEEIKAAQEAAASKWADDMTRLIMGTDRISDDLLNRCAAMNVTLLAQAEKAHAAGDAAAWRDLAWLMETGRQLVALGGEV